MGRECVGRRMNVITGRDAEFQKHPAVINNDVRSVGPTRGGQSAVKCRIDGRHAAVRTLK